MQLLERLETTEADAGVLDFFDLQDPLPVNLSGGSRPSSPSWDLWPVIGNASGLMISPHDDSTLTSGAIASVRDITVLPNCQSVSGVVQGAVFIDSSFIAHYDYKPAFSRANVNRNIALSHVLTRTKRILNRVRIAEAYETLVNHLERLCASSDTSPEYRPTPEVMNDIRQAVVTLAGKARLPEVEIDSDGSVDFFWSRYGGTFSISFTGGGRVHAAEVDAVQRYRTWTLDVHDETDVARLLESKDIALYMLA